MNMFMNIIFLVTCYPILFILYYMLKDADNRNHYCFGATLKKGMKNSEEVKKITAEYKSSLKKCTIIMAILPILFFFIPYFSISMSLWMMWILAVCFVPMIFLIKANRKIIELKTEKGWNEKSNTSYADLKMITIPGKVKFITFLPMLFLSTIPVVIAFILFKGYGYVVFAWIVAIFGLCTYLFYGCAIWTDKQKITVICEDSDINVNFARAKKQIWKKYWIICGWINTVFTWFLFFIMCKREYAMSGVIWGSILYCIIIIAVAIILMKKILLINKEYEEKRTVEDIADDDSHWIWGMIYYNKNDKHFMIENRFGTGTTINMAKKSGMAMTIFSYLAILSLPIICIWIIMLEFTPIQVYIENEEIVCEHLSKEYEIPLDEIDEYTILTERPKMTKVNGNGMDNVLSGTFETEYDEMAEVFLNPQNDLLIKIVVDDQIYYISDVDDEGTKELIEEIEMR